MNKKLKMNSVLIIITICFCTLCNMNDMVIIPIVNSLYNAFPSADPKVLNYILSGPVMIGAIVSLICGKLMYRFKTKTLMVFFFSVFTVGSVLGIAVYNVYYIAFMRTLVGIGYGATLVLEVNILSECFPDEKQRGTAVGIYTASQGVMAAILGLFSGIIGSANWSNVFRIYFAAIPVLIMILVFIPSNPILQIDETGKDQNDEKMPWKNLMLMCAAFCVYTLIYCIIYYQVSMVAIEKDITSSTFIGILSALGMVGGSISAASFGFLYTKLKLFIPTLGFLLQLIAYAMILGCSSHIMFGTAILLCGMSYGIGISWYMMRCTVIVPPVQVPLSISITSTLMSVSTALSTFATTALKNLLHTDSIVSIIPVLLGCLTVASVLSFVNFVKETKPK